MENQNLEQLKKLAQIFNTDKLISPEEIQQIFTGIVEILATYKKGTESINEDTKKVVNKLLEDVISAHEEGMNKAVTTVLSEKENLANGFAEKLTELKLAIDSIKEEMDKGDEEPEDDTDDEEEKQALIEEIMAQIKLPEVKATIVSGEEIIDRINELPLDEDNKIDWARIKNAPKIGKQTIGGSPTVLANAVDLDGSTRQDTYAIVWDAARGRYTHAVAGGGSGSPGGSTTQLQYNNAGAFGGISGATTNGTAVTYTTGNLIGADVKASGSGGLTLKSNNGTTTSLHGAGGGANNTFYGDVKLDYATATTVPYIDASKNLISSAVTPTELGYLSGVTSAIQTQLNAKQATITGAATTITTSDLTASRALISNASGKVAVSSVTDTELGYVSGVTSSIQTQLNAKGTGSVTSVDVSGGTTGLTFTGGPVTTSGTITAAGTLAVANGGTGQTSYTNGQLLIGNTTGNTLTKATLTGTANQVVVTNGGGSITLSTPQDIGTSSNPQFATIELGAASDTTLSRSSAGVLAVEGVVIPSISSTNTLTNKRITKRVGTTTSSATPTINTDNVDMYTLTAQAVDITSFTTNLSGTPTDGQTLWIAITGTAARAITWGASFEASTVALPTTTVSTNRLDVGFVWNTATSKWRCIASA